MRACRLVTSQLTQGAVNIITTEANAPLLAGNLISNLLSLVIVVSVSLIFPEGRFDWNILKERISMADEEVREACLPPDMYAFDWCANPVQHVLAMGTSCCPTDFLCYVTGGCRAVACRGAVC